MSFAIVSTFASHFPWHAGGKKFLTLAALGVAMPEARGAAAAGPEACPNARPQGGRQPRARSPRRRAPARGALVTQRDGAAAAEVKIGKDK